VTEPKIHLYIRGITTECGLTKDKGKFIEPYTDWTTGKLKRRMVECKLHSARGNIVGPDEVDKVTCGKCKRSREYRCLTEMGRHPKDVIRDTIPLLEKALEFVESGEMSGDDEKMARLFREALERAREVA